MNSPLRKSWLWGSFSMRQVRYNSAGHVLKHYSLSNVKEHVRLTAAIVKENLFNSLSRGLHKNDLAITST